VEQIDGRLSGTHSSHDLAHVILTSALVCKHTCTPFVCLDHYMHASIWRPHQTVNR